jgi:hypothetical protein
LGCLDDADASCIKRHVSTTTCAGKFKPPSRILFTDPLELQPAVSTSRRSARQQATRARSSATTAVASAGVTSTLTPTRTAVTSAGVTAPRSAVTNALPTPARTNASPTPARTNASPTPARTKKKKTTNTAPPLPADSLYRLDTRSAQRDGITATSVGRPNPVKDIRRPKGEHGRRTKGKVISFNMRTYLKMHRPLWRSARVSSRCLRVSDYTHVSLQQWIRIFSYELGLDFNLKLCDQSKLKLGLIARKVM